MKLQSILSVATFFLVCSAYRLNRRLERGDFGDHWANKEDPGSGFHSHKFGIVNDSVLESSDLIILPRPYVNPNKDKYKSKKTPTTRLDEETSASESEED